MAEAIKSRVKTVRESLSVCKKTLLRITSKPMFFYLLAFVLISVYYLSVFDKVDAAEGYYLIHYNYNYSRGFVARGLVGQILSMLFDKITPTVIKGTIVVFDSLLIVSSSLCIGKALNKCRDDHFAFFVVSLAILVLCFCPYTFRYYFADSKLDKLFWALTLFAVYFSDTKHFKWLAPLLCIVAVLVNPVFLFMSNILISLVLLQQFANNRKSVFNGVVCMLTYALLIAIGIYGVISEKWLGFKDAYELMDYYFANYTGELTPAYYSEMARMCLCDYFIDYKDVLTQAFQLYFIGWGNGKSVILDTIFVTIPVFIPLTAFWVSVFKAEKDKFQKLIYFFCIISPVVAVPVTIVSWENSKYFSAIFIVQICLLVYFTVHKNEAVINTLLRIKNYFSSHVISLAALAAFYMLYVFNI